jgi:hypothetical protein
MLKKVIQPETKKEQKNTKINGENREPVTD